MGRGETPKFKKRSDNADEKEERKKENLKLSLDVDENKENTEKVKKKPRKKGTKLNKRNEDDAVDGKENVAYDYSPVKDDTIDVTGLSKIKKKKKKQNTEPAGEVIER